MTVIRLPSIEALADVDALSAVLGPVASVTRAPMGTVGYSGSTHERLEVQLRNGEHFSLVLKHTRLAADWTAYRTGDTIGREAALLGEPALAGVWDAFACPYLAYAAENGQVGLLMEDLGEHFLPDVDEPISQAHEDLFLDALARLHARFWESDALRLPWLASPLTAFAVLGPHSAKKDGLGPIPPELREMVRQGWAAALVHLPERVADVLLRPAVILARECVGLPHTLLHGDAKVANFVPIPDSRVVAIDWEWTGDGPATLDLGWYLAVNAGRLARSKEEVIARYRGLLESELGSPLSSVVWEQMVSIGVLCGAVMLLWDKVPATGSAKALAEWSWWVDQLLGRF